MRSRRNNQVVKAPTLLRRTSALVGLSLCAVAVFGPFAPSATAAQIHTQGELQAFGDRTKRFETVLDVQANGDMVVTETITQEFQEPNRHGIERFIPETQDITDEDGKSTFRRYPISDVTVEAAATTPSQVSLKRSGSDAKKILRIRVGDPNEIVRGTHTYTVRYLVKAVATRFEKDEPDNPAHDELYWNGIGNSWRQPIDVAKVTVKFPTNITRIACFTGYVGSKTPCDGTRSGQQATFSLSSLPAGDAITVVVGSALNSLTVNPLIVVEETGLVKLLKSSYLGILAFLGGAIAVVPKLARAGRDRAFAGLALSASQGEEGTAVDRPIRRADKREGPVEFGPPENARPALLGALEKLAGTKEHMTATIIDLASRGYLIINEEPDTWRLHRTPLGTSASVQSSGIGEGTIPSYNSRKNPPLHDYEIQLLNDLFASGSEVRLSDLDDTFASKYAAFVGRITEEITTHKWTTGNPTTMKAKAAAPGGLAIVLGIAALFLRVGHGIAVGLFALGALILAVAQAAPARSSAGSAMLARTQGFRRFLLAGEPRLEHAEIAKLFIDFLPYAVGFGITKQWSKRFEDLTSLPETGWYRGHGPMSPVIFGGRINDFDRKASTNLTSTPTPTNSGGGSGFSGGSSGGGGGGGGGGSW
jgi:uncharacterized membrane protein YgcG